MKMNMSKVMLGGVIAGVVMIAIGFLSNMYILGPKFVAELDAFKPGLGTSMSQGEGLVWHLLLDVVLGITLVWLYAAIRPRFGPGAGTAIKAALVVWIVTSIAYYGWLSMGMVSSGTWMLAALMGIVNLVLGALAGAKFYSEEPTT